MQSTGLPQEVTYLHATLLTDSTSLLRKVKSGTRSPNRQVSMFHILHTQARVNVAHPPHTGTCQCCTSSTHRHVSMFHIRFPRPLGIYCAGHAELKGNERHGTQIGWESNGGKWLASRKTVLRSLTHKAKDITPPVARRTEAGRRKLSSISR